MTYIKAAMISAATCAGPWMLYQLWLFIASGLDAAQNLGQCRAQSFVLLSRLLFIMFASLSAGELAEAAFAKSPKAYPVAPGEFRP